MVYRIFVEKKREFANEAKALCSDARNLLDGVDFDDYTSTSENESYIRKKTGMFFSSQIEDTFRSGIKIVEESKGDYALSVQTAPVFVNGTVRDENKKDNFKNCPFCGLESGFYA